MNNEVKVVLNENKVKMMTKMAIYEKNEGRKMLRTAKYFKGDFIAFGILNINNYNICIYDSCNYVCIMQCRGTC